MISQIKTSLYPNIRRSSLFDLQAEAVLPYTESAPIYDHLMKDVDYKRWARYLIQLMQVASVDTRRSSLKGKKLCELGSGTGNISFHLAKYGFEVTGIDSSAPMLEVARAKSTKQPSRSPIFINHDMVTYHSEIQYDMIVCVYDSINYIPDVKKLDLFFKNVFLNLKPAGIFIFDASLEPNSMNDPELFMQNGRVKGQVYQRESLYNKKTRTHTTRIRVQRDGKVFEEIHSEYVYGLDILRQLSMKAGFSEKFAASDFTLLEADENSERVHFILTK